MNNFHPLVSIVIPVYNGSNYVREAIDSALAQTYDNIEVIVVNDGSTDNTDEIVRSYGDRLRYFKKRNGGVSTALNLAIKKSKGEYISWLSHDDMYYPNKIERQIEELNKIDKNKVKYAILYSDYFVIDLVNGNSRDNIMQPNINSHFSKWSSIMLLFESDLHGCTLLIPKVCFSKIGYFDKNLFNTQDYDLWFRFIKYGCIFIHVNKTLIATRHHSEQSSVLKSKFFNAEIESLYLNAFKMFETFFVRQKLSEKIKLFSIISNKRLKLLSVYLSKYKFYNEGEHLSITEIDKETDKNIYVKILAFLKYVFRIINPVYRKLLFIDERLNRLENIFYPSSEKMIERNNIISSVYELVDKMSKELDFLNKVRLNSLTEEISEVNINLTKLSKNVNRKKTPLISIICLIYKSTNYAKAVHDSLYKYTPLLRNGKAELLFIANDATREVINFLKKEKYNFVINNNEYITDENLFKNGYGTPEYISRVYKGYNYGIKKSKGDIVVLINSDNMFSPKWLENMLDIIDEKKILDSQIVERNHPKFGIFPKAILGEFGSHPNNYKEDLFLKFVKKISKNKLSPGGAYMPCMVYKNILEKVGYFPEGNIAGKSFNEIIKYGDERLYDKLDAIGVKHYTVCNSIVYHFKEGEKED